MISRSSGTKKGYYVDKTLLISDVLDSSLTKVFLYTRPRRFGKSLNLSMLDAYLNLEYAGNTWFDGLAISGKRPEDPLKNSFPVIDLNLKDMDVRDYGGFLDRIRVKMTDLYTHFDYLQGSDHVPSAYSYRFLRVRDGMCNDAELSASLRIIYLVSNECFESCAIRIRLYWIKSAGLVEYDAQWSGNRYGFKRNTFFSLS